MSEKEIERCHICNSGLGRINEYKFNKHKWKICIRCEVLLEYALTEMRLAFEIEHKKHAISVQDDFLQNGIRKRVWKNE